MAPERLAFYNARQEGAAFSAARISAMHKRANRWTFETVVIVCLYAVACAPVSDVWDDCQFRAPRSVTMDAAGLRSVSVQAFSGTLEVVGVQDLAEVRVTGSACAVEEQWLEGIDVKTERRDSEIVIEAVAPAGRAWEGTGRLDLEIEVPSSTRLDIVDGSGAIEIANVAGLRIDDGAGSLSISAIGGDVEIKDGGGELDVEDVCGHVKIEDGRGDITVRDIGGSVTMSDRNGDISVKRVGGNFTLSSDTNGSVSHSDVAGRVSVPGEG